MNISSLCVVRANGKAGAHHATGTALAAAAAETEL